MEPIDVQPVGAFIMYDSVGRQLHVKTSQGFTPGRLERLAGLTTIDEGAWVTTLCLTDNSSRRLLPNRNIAKVFASVISKLLQEQSVCFLFPSDLPEVKRRLRTIDVGMREVEKSLLVEVPAQELGTLNRILEAGAFTAFYCWSDGMKVTASIPSILFKNLDTIQFVAVFSLFDETMEVISKLIPIELVKNLIQEVCEEEHIEAS